MIKLSLGHHDFLFAVEGGKEEWWNDLEIYDNLNFTNIK